jgi:ABC-type uncharacterized transport system substrate-binding protein
MSKFFDSEIIQQELEEIHRLQQEIYGSVLQFAYMTKESKLDHIEKLTNLLEKQKIMYTRLSLSNDPMVQEMKDNLKKSVVLMGFPEDTDLNLLFNSMTQTIESLKKYIDG